MNGERLLLDSHVALWWLIDGAELGPGSRSQILTAGEVFFSPASTWKLGIKKALGRLVMPEGLAEELVRCGFIELPTTCAHAAIAAALPLHHRDPFDRMLIAQAIAEALTLVTADDAIAAYRVDVLSARA